MIFFFPSLSPLFFEQLSIADAPGGGPFDQRTIGKKCKFIVLSKVTVMTTIIWLTGNYESSIFLSEGHNLIF